MATARTSDSIYFDYGALTNLLHYITEKYQIFKLGGNTLEWFPKASISNIFTAIFCVFFFSRSIVSALKMTS